MQIDLHKHTLFFESFWNIAVVCDSNTHPIATRFLPNHPPLVLPAHVEASVAEAEAIAARTHAATHLVAVGSGTVNDLVKYAAFISKKPYFCLPTAPSMNGYLSPTASLHAEGKKQSLSAAPPQAVWIAKDVLASAPWELIAAGVGDSLCRSTVQCDWLLSHLLLGTAYDASLFTPMLPHEQWLMDHPESLLNREEQAITHLMQLLLLGGEAMDKAGSSAPASQGEHMIAHAMENGQRTAPLHGHAIAVTTLTMARLQAEILSHPTLQLVMPQPDPQALENRWGAQATEQYLAATAHKILAPEQLTPLNQRLAKDWPAIAEQIRALHVPAKSLENLYRTLTLPTLPEDVGWDTAVYHQTLPLVRFTRERFTFLDLAADQ
jgi:glycerol-1-phosphate dehydrogenase [NAD(P)+]